MHYEKALNVLGLKPGFTEEELKTAYRTLMNKYHPDRYENSKDKDEMVKRAQELNAARDYMKNHKFHNQDNNKSTSDLEKYINQKSQELVNLTTFDLNKYQLSIKMAKIIIALKFLPDSFYFESIIKESKAYVDYKFEIYLKKIIDAFYELETEFFKENHIDKCNIKENINYNCSLREFYEQLLKIKEKYGKENIIKKKLEEETLKYKDYAGYKDIKKLIEVCIKNTLITIRNNGFNYNQKDIDNMHQEILECFQIYHTLKQKISKLEEIVSTIDDNKIKINYSKLVLDFYAGSALSDIENRIAEIEKTIEKYKKIKQQKIVFEQNKQEIENIYRSLIDRYSNVLKQCNINTNYDAIIYFNELIKELLTLFRKGYQELEELDYFKLFNLISFSNVENDHMIIKSIKSHSNSQSKSFSVFLRKGEKRLGEANSFFIIIDETMKMLRINTSTSYIFPKIMDYGYVSDNELKGTYISLEEFLDKSRFVGEYRKFSDGKTIELLYQMNRQILYRENGLFCVGYNEEKYMKYHSKDKNLDVFKDREYVSSLIEKQLTQTMKDFIDKCQKSHEDEFSDVKLDDIDNTNKKRK